MNNQFSENLKKIRKEHHLSQEQLADELGVSRQAISKWESAIAYPEMDKIIFLCDKFNLNIDDLLHKDIKEVKGEEESKRKINNAIDEFLKFITDTVNLFSNMNFKSKVKCLFEQVITALILLVVSVIIVYGLDRLLIGILSFMPYQVTHFIVNTLILVLVVLCTIFSVVILTHIFKTRYLDYYLKLKKESKEKNKEEELNRIDEEKKISFNRKNKILFRKNENKIIIRDPKHSEYKFINGLFKLIIGIIKFFMILFVFMISFILICFLFSFILSFLVYKTGFFFIGLLLAILSLSIITIILLLLLLNFIMNRKNDKKKIIWCFISSLIVFGISCGFIFIGTLNFEVLKNNEGMLKKESKEYNMNNDLLFYPQYDVEVRYVEADIDNIKVEYLLNKYYEIEEHISDDEKYIMVSTTCKDGIKLLKGYINNLNHKKIVEMTGNIESITIYASKDNIETIKNNWNNHIKSIKSYDEMINFYEKRIDELETENEKLNDTIYDLETKIEND